ncbi:MAG: amino acid racemase [Anaerolineae bacterium]|nr:amino acid racemase [Anaerolineae bacterium]
MKKIGILGGLGPESTLKYYRLIIDLCRERGLGGNYPEIIIYSLNFKECHDLMESGRQREYVAKLVGGIQSLHRAGADFALIASNTPHIFFDELKARSPIPLLSIVEATCDAVAKRGLERVGLFGTRVTMQADFFQKVFHRRNISVIVPGEEEQAYIDDKIFSELVLGKVLDETHRGFLEIVRRMIERDAIEGLILGCTELSLILPQDELGIPFFDTTKVHAQSALDYSLSGE